LGVAGAAVVEPALTHARGQVDLRVPKGRFGDHTFAAGANAGTAVTVIPVRCAGVLEAHPRSRCFVAGRDGALVAVVVVTVAIDQALVVGVAGARAVTVTVSRTLASVASGPSGLVDRRLRQALTLC